MLPKTRADSNKPLTDCHAIIFLMSSVVLDKRLLPTDTRHRYNPCSFQIVYVYDKSKPMVLINLLQPHEPHGTFIKGQFSLYTKPLKTKHKP